MTTITIILKLLFIACGKTINETATLAIAMFSVFLRKGAAGPINLTDLSLHCFFNLFFLVRFH